MMNPPIMAHYFIWTCREYSRRNSGRGVSVLLWILTGYSVSLWQIFDVHLVPKAHWPKARRIICVAQ